MKATCITFPEPRVVSVGSFEVSPPGAGQILTRTLVTGVSTGTETRVFRGRQSGSRFPLIPGYENLGQAVEAGPGTELAAGDRVFVKAHQYSADPYSLCWGGQTSHSVSAAAAAIPVPDSLSDDDAIFCKIAGISLHGVRRAGVKQDDWVVVVGLGIIGHFVVQHAAALGARVIGIDLEPDRLELARQGGATHCFDGRDVNLANTIKDLTGGGCPT